MRHKEDKTLRKGQNTVASEESKTEFKTTEARMEARIIR